MSYKEHPAMTQARELFRAAHDAREKALRIIDATVDQFIDDGLEKGSPERIALAEWRLDLVGAVRPESDSGLVLCAICPNPINPPSSSRFCLDCHTAEIEREILEARRAATQHTTDELEDPTREGDRPDPENCPECGWTVGQSGADSCRCSPNTFAGDPREARPFGDAVSFEEEEVAQDLDLERGELEDDER